MKMMNAITAGSSVSTIAIRRRTISSTVPPIAAIVGPHPRPQVNVHR